jgi:hypothetical protein
VVGGAHRFFLTIFVAALAAAWLSVLSGGAAAASTTGYDISYPQCNGSFPASPSFGIVGVNGGKPFSANLCLGAGDGPSELSWAGMNAGLYANTADPGPNLSTHWPNGQTSPEQCNTATNPGSDTSQCNYDYGWNAAADGYQDAVNAYVALGWAPGGSTRTPVANGWWLDVESANSWQSSTGLNVDALQGEADYLKSVGAGSIGFYATASDWQSITGNTTSFAAYPSWLPGASSLSQAQANCTGAGVTGGGVALTQYPANGFDGDYRCSAQASSLSFTSPPQTLTAGSASGPMTVSLQQAAVSATSVTLTSTSPAGSFATSSGGPWSSSVTVSVSAGSTASASFYYSDTRAGSPVLTATASGYGNGTETETVLAGPLASIGVSPTSAQVRVGAHQSFTATGRDRYGNTVAVTPSWSVSPSLGTFSPNPGNPATFSAKVAGSGTITATGGGVSGSATITVTTKKHGTATVTTPSSARIGATSTRTASAPHVNRPPTMLPAVPGG